MVCFRVVMGFVICRLDCKEFVLWHSSLPKLTAHGAVCAEQSSVFVIRYCRLNWTCDILWTLLNSWVWCLFYIDSISQDCKLYLIIKHVTLSNLCLPNTVSVIISTVMSQHSDMAQCNIMWKSCKTHKNTAMSICITVSDITPIISLSHQSASSIQQ